MMCELLIQRNCFAMNGKDSVGTLETDISNGLEKLQNTDGYYENLAQNQTMTAKDNL